MSGYGMSATLRATVAGRAELVSNGLSTTIIRGASAVLLGLATIQSVFHAPAKMSRVWQSASKRCLDKLNRLACGDH